MLKLPKKGYMNNSACSLNNYSHWEGENPEILYYVGLHYFVTNMRSFAGKDKTPLCSTALNIHSCL